MPTSGEVKILAVAVEPTRTFFKSALTPAGIIKISACWQTASHNGTAEMNQDYMEEEIFQKRDFTTSFLPKGSYESCTFIDCDFSNSDISDSKFMECEFKRCNLTMVELSNTILMNIKFSESKMLGLQFANCNTLLLSVSFSDCILNHSSFFTVNLKKTVFENTKLREVDFTKSDLTSSIFNNCDFTGAIFINTCIEKSDFSSSYNYVLDPDVNRIKKAKFGLPGVLGLLAKYDIEIQ